MKGPNNWPWADRTGLNRTSHTGASLGGQLWEMLPQEWLYPGSSYLPLSQGIVRLGSKEAHQRPYGPSCQMGDYGNDQVDQHGPGL